MWRFLLITLLAVPSSAFAVGLDADMQCIPAIPPCPCGTIMGKGGCVAGPNKYLCPCKDSTNGFTVMGQCDATQRCTAKSAQGQNGASGMPQLPQIPSGGGGGGDQGQPQDPCSGIVGSAGASSSACGAGAGYAPVPSTYNDIISSLFTPVGSSTVGAGLIGSLSVPDAKGPITIKIGSTTVSQKGDSSGTSGDISVKDKSVITTASSRDTKKNVQVSGFLGVTTKSADEAKKLAQSMCVGQIWAGGFLSSIVPSSILNNVCVAKSFIAAALLGGTSSAGTAAKSGTTVAPKSIYEAGTIQLGNLPSTPPEAKDMTPDAQIWAVPEKVFRNNKATVYWSAKNVDTCVVRSADGSQFGTGLEGNRATPVLTRATVYTFQCKTKAGQTYSANIGIAVE